MCLSRRGALAAPRAVTDVDIPIMLPQFKHSWSRFIGRSTASAPSISRSDLEIHPRELRKRGARRPGTISLGGYSISYVDFATFIPQWNEIVIREGLRFRCPHESPRVLDCGANIGLASLYFKRLYPLAIITAYEPDPFLASYLRRNLEANGASDVGIVEAAVWTSNGLVDFHCEGTDSGGISSTVPQDLEGTVRQLPAVRLRDALEHQHIDFLKLDIEGAEAAVLKDCMDVLQNVSAMVLEVHEFNPHNRITPSVLGVLEDCGFKYAMDQLLPMFWRPHRTDHDAVLPSVELMWVVLVRAWRE